MAIPLVSLPAEFRGAIIANACPPPSRLRACWKSTRKPFSIGLSAAWLIIVGLYISTPEVSDPAVASRVSPVESVAARNFIAWVDGKHLDLEYP